MLEEAVAALKGGEGALIEDQWSPQINLGTAVLIPEDYVARPAGAARRSIAGCRASTDARPSRPSPPS